MKVLFVCTGNTCRSPMAEGIFAKMVKVRGVEGVEAASRGLSVIPGTPVSQNAFMTMGEKIINIGNHLVRQVSRGDIEESDLILTMTKNHKYALFSMFAMKDRHIYTLKEFVGGYDDRDISDPIGGDMEVYRETAREIEEALEKGFDKIVGYRKGE